MIRNRSLAGTSVLLLLTLAVSGAARPARITQLDKSFGTQGQVLKADSSTSAATGVGVLKNGRIVTCSVGTRNGGSVLLLDRFLKTGRLDKKFGTLGEVVHTFAGPEVRLLNARVLADGKVIAGGSLSGAASVFRFLATGALDTTFGTGGVVAIETGYTLPVADVALHPDGRIIAVTTGREEGVLKSVVVGLNPNGSESFRFSGDLNKGIIGPNGVTVQPDGKILIATGGISGAAVVRLGANGSPDAGFGDQGVAVIDALGGYSGSWAVAVALDGRIATTGWSSDGEGPAFIARLMPNGTLDNGFGAGGITVGPMGMEGRFVMVQKDGKVVAGGIGSGNSGFMSRFTAAGQLDELFGSCGIILFTQAGGQIGLTSGAFQKDGRIVACGRSNDNLLLQRYR